MIAIVNYRIDSLEGIIEAILLGEEEIKSFSV